MFLHGRPPDQRLHSPCQDFGLSNQMLMDYMEELRHDMIEQFMLMLVRYGSQQGETMTVKTWMKNRLMCFSLLFHVSFSFLT